MLCRNAARNLVAVAKGLQAGPLPKSESASGQTASALAPIGRLADV